MPERAARGASAQPASSGQRLHTNAERWLSGRKHRTRNAAYGQPYRGFESHPLRQQLIRNCSQTSRNRQESERSAGRGVRRRALTFVNNRSRMG